MMAYTCRYAWCCLIPMSCLRTPRAEPMGVELYDHRNDTEADFDRFENVNVAGTSAFYNATAASLLALLKSTWDNGRLDPAPAPHAAPRTIHARGRQDGTLSGGHTRAELSGDVAIHPRWRWSGCVYGVRCGCDA